jgi:hypothetical protein
MTLESKELYNSLPVGKILIEGSIRRNTDTWYSVPFCIAKGPTSYIGYIVLLAKVNSQNTAFDDILDRIFPSNTLITSNGVTGLERPYYIGHRVVGFDSGGFNPGTQLSFPEYHIPTIPGETFDVFCTRVVTNAMVAYNKGWTTNFDRTDQLEIDWDPLYATPREVWET